MDKKIILNTSRKEAALSKARIDEINSKTLTNAVEIPEEMQETKCSE
jgi:hypothetical protein